MPFAADKPAAEKDAVARIGQLKGKGFPLIDFHAHLKGGLTLDEVLAHAQQTGISYGIAPNCGIGFPITDDAGIRDFLADEAASACSWACRPRDANG